MPSLDTCDFLNSRFNDILQADPKAQERLESIGEQTVRIELEPFPAFGLYIQKGELTFGTVPEEPSLTIAAHVAAFMRYGMTGQRDEIQLLGEVEVAQDLRNFFLELAIDWEELLSHVVGDTPARVIGRTLTEATQTAQTLGKAVVGNLRDYLHEESRVMPHQEEIDAFVRDVDNLRDDLERLEVRLNKVSD